MPDLSPSWARRWPERRAGSWAARCATSSSAAPWSTSTLPAASRSVRRGRSRALAAARRFRSPSVTGHGGSLSRTGGPSTSRRCRVASRTTSRAATSRSTPWPARSTAASSSIPSAGSATSPSARSAQSRRASSRLTRYACCVPSGSRTSSASASTPRRRSSFAGTRSLRRARRASGSSASSSASRPPATAASRSSACSTRSAARLRSSTGSTSSTHPTTASCACSASRCGGFRSRAASTGTRARCSRAEPPADASPRAIHRFRRATEPWAPDALAFLGLPELRPAIEQARAADPAAPLLRGDELGLSPGPEIGRLLELIAEERAAGTITTREEALELVRREAR